MQNRFCLILLESDKSRRQSAVLDASGLKVGQVHGLILESEGRQASRIILRHQEPLAAPRYRVVPADLVADVQAGEVHLCISADHVYGLGAYRPVPEQDE